MLTPFGLGTPRGLQRASPAIRDLVPALVVLCATICRVVLSTTSKPLGLALRTFDSARRLAENHIAASNSPLHQRPASALKALAERAAHSVLPQWVLHVMFPRSMPDHAES